MKEKYKMLEIQEDLKERLWEKYLVQNQLQQHAILYKILNAEGLRLEKERKVQKANCDLAVDKLKIANDFEIKVYNTF